MPAVPMGQIMGVGHRGVLFIALAFLGISFGNFLYWIIHFMIQGCYILYHVAVPQNCSCFHTGVLCLTESHRPIGGSHTESDIFNVQPCLILLFLYLLESENRCQISTAASFQSQV